MLVTMKELPEGYDIVDIGRRSVNAVASGAEYHPHHNVHLHAKVPLVPFPGLMYFRIALAALVLGVTRCKMMTAFTMLPCLDGVIALLDFSALGRQFLLKTFNNRPQFSG
jgi:hypothetical protein